MNHARAFVLALCFLGAILLVSEYQVLSESQAPAKLEAIRPRGASPLLVGVTDADGYVPGFGAPRSLPHKRDTCLSTRPPLYDEWRKWAKAHRCQLDDCAYRRIAEDLAPFIATGGIRKSQIAKAAALDRTGVMRVVDNRLQRPVTTHWAMPQYAAMFNKLLLANATLPNVTMVVSVLDEPRVIAGTLTGETVEGEAAKEPQLDAHLTESARDVLRACPNSPFAQLIGKHAYLGDPASYSVTKELVPVLSATKPVGCYEDILIPGYHWYGENWRKNVDGWNAENRWSDKINDVVWRGSTTGTANTEENYMRSHRYRMVEFFRGRSDKRYDVAFNTPSQCAPATCQAIRDNALIRPSFEYPELWKHKYFLDIDGNSFSMRFVYFLSSNSPALHAVGGFTEFYHSWLTPGEHFVPFSFDFTDIDDKVTYLLEHDAEARKIAEASRVLMKRHGRVDDGLCYLYRLIIEYASLVVDE